MGRPPAAPLPYYGAPMSREPLPPIPAATVSRLCLTVKETAVSLFFPLLQQGFGEDVPTGISVRELLSGTFGIPAEYVENRIQTIFLDGKPIDDMDAAIVRDGSTLALSSAMPGVLGATLRRGGYYAGMRSQITHTEAAEAPVSADGRITVKLFNMTVRELGPLFLLRGIGIEAAEAGDFFGSQRQDWREMCVAAALDGAAIDPAGLASPDFPGYVWLEVRPA